MLGVALNNVTAPASSRPWCDGLTGGVGFTVAIVLFASVRERLELAECPESFEGFPIALVSAGLIALAFMGFHGPVGLRLREVRHE